MMTNCIAILTRTNALVPLVDADKFGRLTHRISTLHAGIDVITDARLTTDWQSKLRDLNGRVTLTDPI